jgi:DNA-binding transcriptional ArsR family regulator
MAHPLRVQILGILEQRVASPRELADELDAPLGNVSYHVRTLSSLGLIKLVKKTPRRGAIEHYYEARGRAVVTDRAWAEVPEIVKRALVGATLGDVSERVNDAAAAGGFDRDDAHLTSPRVIVDEQGFGELSGALNELFDRVDKIQRESTKRLKGDDVGAIEAGVVAMLFERSNGEAAKAEGGARERTRDKAGSRR